MASLPMLDSPDLVRRELHERVLGYVSRRVRSREDAEERNKKAKPTAVVH